MKYRILGTVNIISAAIVLLIQIGLLRSVIKLYSLYQSFNAQLPLTTTLSPFLSVAIIGITLYVLYIGYKLISVKDGDARLFKKGVILLVVTLGMVFLLTAISVLSVIVPIYTMTEYL